MAWPVTSTATSGEPVAGRARSEMVTGADQPPPGCQDAAATVLATPSVCSHTAIRWPLGPAAMRGVSSSGPLESSDTNTGALQVPPLGRREATTRRLVAPLWIQTAVALPALSTMTAGETAENTPSERRTPEPAVQSVLA